MIDPGWTTPARSQIDALPATRAGLLTAALTTQAAARTLSEALGVGVVDQGVERSWRFCQRAVERMSGIVAEPHARPVRLPPPDVLATADHRAELAQLIGEVRALATELLDVQVKPLGAAHARTVRDVHRLLSHALEELREAAA